MNRLSPMVSRSSLLRRCLEVTVPLLLLAGVGALQAPRLQALRQENSAPSLMQIQQEAAATQSQIDLIREMPTFGFRNVIADWLFLDFIQYFGNTPARQQTNYHLSPEYFDVILDLDPYFLQGYFFLSSSSSLFAGMPDRTVEIIERELPHLSPTLPDRAYYVWRYKGIDELLFLGRSQDAQKSFATAAEWASVYDTEEGRSVAQISQRMATFLARKPDSTYAQISAWVMVYYNAMDQSTQVLAIQRIQELGGQVRVNENGVLNVTLPSED